MAMKKKGGKGKSKAGKGHCKIKSHSNKIIISRDDSSQEEKLEPQSSSVNDSLQSP